jgi:hypothetical protein
LFKVYIQTKLLYGCETWAPTKAEFKKLESIQYNMLLKIMRKRQKDRISYRIVLNETNMVPIESYVRQQRLVYVGNIERMGDERIPKRMFYGEVIGNRNCGKPAFTLLDAHHQDLVEFNIGGNWKEIAQNQTTWLDTIKRGKDDFIEEWHLRKIETERSARFSLLPFHQEYIDNWNLRKLETERSMLFSQLPNSPVSPM